ncbi:MAG: glycosyltransferase family 2 protein, partial [Treponema sp.]|nr:glycosyltransferase family 2 protein [Treponema sp.]
MEKLIVVITTYNLEKYISEALDSVLRQKTNFHFKILIGDDASTDKTLDILNEYVEKFPDIIDLRLSQTNLGSLCNSNRLFDGLNCEYFTFLDGDDYWEDEYRLQKQIDFLDSHPDYMMCAGNTQYIKNGIKSDFLLTEKELGRTYTFEDYINQNMPFFHVSSIVIRNKIYINGLPECYK